MAQEVVLLVHSLKYVCLQEEGVGESECGNMDSPFPARTTAMQMSARHCNVKKMWAFTGLVYATKFSHSFSFLTWAFHLLGRPTYPSNFACQTNHFRLNKL